MKKQIKRKTAGIRPMNAKEIKTIAGGATCTTTKGSCVITGGVEVCSEITTCVYN